MIEELKILEHARERPGMYIGSVDYLGFNEMLYGLIKDFIAKDFFEINCVLKKNNHFVIEFLNAASSSFIFETIKHIDDYTNNKFCFSLAVIIPLSDSLTIAVDDSNVLQSERGVYKIIGNVEKRATKITIDFILDKDIFKGLNLNYQHLYDLLRRFAYLNSNLKIKSIDESTNELQINIFHFPNGLVDLFDFELEKNFRYDSPLFKLNFNRQTDYSYSLALAFVYGSWIKPKIEVYADYRETILGGSLLNGILQGFKSFFKEEALKKNINLNISNTKLKKHLLLYASVNGELTYLGPTKWKLGTPKVQHEIKEFIYQELKLYFTDKENELKGVLDVLQTNY